VRGWHASSLCVAQNERFWHGWKSFLFFISEVAKNHNMALCSPILALGQYKRAKEMSYEYLDTRKCCHAKLWEKAHPLKALGSVARFLRNSQFFRINDSTLPRKRSQTALARGAWRGLEELDGACRGYPCESWSEFAIVSWMRDLGTCPYGVASRSCCAIHASVGAFVTPCVGCLAHLFSKEAVLTLVL